MNANFLKAIICISALLSLASCTNDDELHFLELKAQNRDVISFNVTSDRPTRTGLLNSSEDITKFMVSARINKPSGDNTWTNENYFNNDFIGKEFENWVNQNGERYWPNNGETLDFYAWTSSANITSINGYKKLHNIGYFYYNNGKPYVTSIYTTTEDDFCYACAKSVTKSDNNSSSKVTLQFRHALAQIGISAKVTNPSLRIEISKITLKNLLCYGNFYFPKISTYEDFSNISDNQKCYWEDGTAYYKNIVHSLIQNKVLSMKMSGDYFVEGIVDLTAPQSPNEKPNTFMIMPCKKYIKINPKDFNIDPSAGTCIILKCKIWNIADINKGYQDTDIQIFGDPEANNGYADLYIPVALNTEPGKKYTYTITFGKGNAGYDVNGNPSIVKVDWNVESKEWTEGLPKPQPIEM